MMILLKHINESFNHLEKKELSYDKWRTSVTYKWNADSSVAMVASNKTLAKGFRREVFLHVGDTVMFVHRFSTEPLGLGNTRNYSFLESIYYLEDVGTIKYLARISYRELDLADTIAFRKKPFADLTDNTSHYYSLEVQNSQNILTLN